MLTTSRLAALLGAPALLLVAAHALAQEPPTDRVDPRLKAQTIAAVTAQAKTACAERKAGSACALSGRVGQGVCQPATSCEGKDGCQIVLACTHKGAVATKRATNADLEAQLGPSDRLDTSTDIKTSDQHRRILNERPAPDPRLARVSRERAAATVTAEPDEDGRFFNSQAFAAACKGKKEDAACAVAGQGKGVCASVAVCKGDACTSHLRCEVGEEPK